VTDETPQQTVEADRKESLLRYSVAGGWVDWLIDLRLKGAGHYDHCSTPDYIACRGGLR